jgi:hypothetical protein
MRAGGRPISRAALADHPELAARIPARREEGWTLQAIADELNADGVPTLRGGSEWRAAAVGGALGYRQPKSRRGAELPAIPHGRASRVAGAGYIAAWGRPRGTAMAELLQLTQRLSEALRTTVHVLDHSTAKVLHAAAESEEAESILREAARLRNVGRG